MSGLADIMWQTMNAHYKAIVENICNEYETDKEYKVEKIYENGTLKGFYCYRDYPQFRFLEFAAYVGEDKTVALRIWKAMTKGIKNIRLLAQRPNVKMIAFYKKRGFVSIQEDLNNILMERRR